jgi:hypothetical protein
MDCASEFKPPTDNEENTDIEDFSKRPRARVEVAHFMTPINKQYHRSASLHIYKMRSFQDKRLFEV